MLWPPYLNILFIHALAPIDYNSWFRHRVSGCFIMYRCEPLNKYVQQITGVEVISLIWTL